MQEIRREAMQDEIQTRLGKHRQIAEELLSLSGEPLRIKQLKSYIVLERKTRKSDLNKNAVSLLREGVSFMLPDWGAEGLAKSLGLATERSKSFPRLVFPELSLADVQKHQEYFTSLTREATREAERLQGLGVVH